MSGFTKNSVIFYWNWLQERSLIGLWTKFQKLKDFSSPIGFASILLGPIFSVGTDKCLSTVSLPERGLALKHMCSRMIPNFILGRISRHCVNLAVQRMSRFFKKLFPSPSRRSATSLVLPLTWRVAQVDRFWRSFYFWLFFTHEQAAKRRSNMAEIRNWSHDIEIEQCQYYFIGWNPSDSPFWTWLAWSWCLTQRGSKGVTILRQFLP